MTAGATCPPSRADSVIVVGYAKVPHGSASHASHEFLSITLRVDRSTGKVTEVDSTAATALVRDRIAELLIDVDLRRDVGAIMKEVDACYPGHAAGCVKQAITDAWRRFAACLENHDVRSLP